MSLRTEREQKTETLSVRVTPTMLKEIKERASAKGVPYAQFIFDAIARSLANEDESPLYMELRKRIEILEELVMRDTV